MLRASGMEEYTDVKQDVSSELPMVNISLGHQGASEK